MGPMTNRQKLEYHIKEAERWQESVLSMETEALEEAKARVKRDKSGQRPLYIAKTILTDNFWYDQAVANRNGHQEQARMYGLAALVDEISFRPPAVDRGSEL